MFSIIREWELSNLTKKSFCGERQIPISVFLYWCRKYRKSQSPGGFVPMKVQSSTEHGSVIEIKYPNGVALRLPTQTSPSVVGAYLHFALIQHIGFHYIVVLLFSAKDLTD